MLKIYNTLSRKKENFIPIDEGKVRMYVCGMTVYDVCHLGHARVLVVFDTFYRLLQEMNFEVIYVRNITDIDDKIIQKTLSQKTDIKTLTEHYIKLMHEDCLALNVKKPNFEPRATDNINNIIKMIGKLIQNNYAYQANNGDVYYSVKKFKNYGKLSGKKIEDLQAGSRIEIDKNKKNPMDFVLWKTSKKDEPSWKSPWGDGRPGWHIECSAMSSNILGDTFDIHGGGCDLQFPHHENEIAQSEGANTQKFVHYWMHNGFVQINKEKMSKSLNNFFTIKEVLEKYTGEEIRFFILNCHYRSPLNYFSEQLDNAKNSIRRLYTSLKDFNIKPKKHNNKFYDRFISAMSDDMNTPEALAVLFDLSHKINIDKDVKDAQLLLYLANTLGILQQKPTDYLQQPSDDITADEIEKLISERKQAREDKDYQKSDEIRDKLQNQNIELEDNKNGTTWRKM
ncbi:MAG: cysteine--tRNA ligase [Gammaproteobacteria bacterium]|nr:MAG: cysteine--tRNA ligase [Gammaproteobacteria bacterium]